MIGNRFREVNTGIRVWIALQFQGDQELLIDVSVVWFTLSQSAETIVSQLQVLLLTCETMLTRVRRF